MVFFKPISNTDRRNTTNTPTNAGNNPERDSIKPAAR